MAETPSDRETDVGRLYARHRQGLYTLAVSVTGCAARAEDAVHDAFERMCHGGGALAGAKDPVAYVFAAVRNAAVDQVRRARPAGDAVASDAGGASSTASLFNGRASGPEALAVSAEVERSVAAAIDGLPAEQKEAVVLRVYAGLTFAQIARVVDAPLPTVATRYRRALERLKQKLEKLA